MGTLNTQSNSSLVATRPEAHPDAAAGPRAIFGSQLPRPQRGVQIFCTVRAHLDALRAEDGSRSVPSVRRSALAAVSRCAPRPANQNAQALSQVAPIYSHSLGGRDRVK